jgi:hypothetical protein
MPRASRGARLSRVGRARRRRGPACNRNNVTLWRIGPLRCHIVAVVRLGVRLPVRLERPVLQMRTVPPRAGAPAQACAWDGPAGAGRRRDGLAGETGWRGRAGGGRTSGETGQRGDGPAGEMSSGGGRASRGRAGCGARKVDLGGRSRAPGYLGQSCDESEESRAAARPRAERQAGAAAGGRAAAGVWATAGFGAWADWGRVGVAGRGDDGLLVRRSTS